MLKRRTANMEITVNTSSGKAKPSIEKSRYIDRIVHKHGQYNVMNTPIALHISECVLTLPMYADLALEDVDRICDIIISCKK